MIPAKYRARVIRMYHEPENGWFIDLSRGWRQADDIVHGIVETRKADALRVLRETVRCECRECK